MNKIIKLFIIIFISYSSLNNCMEEKRERKELVEGMQELKIAAEKAPKKVYEPTLEDIVSGVIYHVYNRSKNLKNYGRARPKVIKQIMLIEVSNILEHYLNYINSFDMSKTKEFAKKKINNLVDFQFGVVTGVFKKGVF